MSPTGKPFESSRESMASSSPTFAVWATYERCCSSSFTSESMTWHVRPTKARIRYLQPNEKSLDLLDIAIDWVSKQKLGRR